MDSDSKCHQSQTANGCGDPKQAFLADVGFEKDDADNNGGQYSKTADGDGGVVGVHCTA